MIDPTQTIELSSDFSDDQLLAICEAADVINCQCPSYLVRLLHETREFRRYTEDCTDHFPEDREVHEWLSNRVEQVEKLLSVIIVEFLHKENLLESPNQLNLNKLAQRSRELVLSHKSA